MRPRAVLATTIAWILPLAASGQTVVWPTGDATQDTAAVQAVVDAGGALSRFTPRDSAVFGEGVHVFFDTHTLRNVFRGSSGRVRDLGVDNVFHDGGH